MSWMRPERSTRSRNAAPPLTRRAPSRPATRRRSPVWSPGSSDPNAARTASIGVTPGKACGNGSMPSARRRSSFSRRTASRSLDGSPPAPCSEPLIGGRLLLRDRLDLGDLELALGAPGDGDLDLLVAAVAEQGLADRGLVGQAVGRRVGLGRADDRVLDRLAGLLVLDVDHRADADFVVGHPRRVDHRGRPQLLLELGDLRLEHGLLVLGVVVLGVLHDVAELPSLLDPGGDLAALVVGEVLELALELLETGWSENDVLGHRLCWLKRPSRPTKTRRAGGMADRRGWYE